LPDDGEAAYQRVVKLTTKKGAGPVMPTSQGGPLKPRPPRAGLRAVSLALLVLVATAGAQAAVFIASGSVALLADLIHNAGDAATAIPLGLAFLLRSASAERLAGLARRLRDPRGRL
jgi:hypothetical protein